MQRVHVIISVGNGDKQTWLRMKTECRDRVKMELHVEPKVQPYPCRGFLRG
jgi:hypothetical protein